MKLKHFAPRGSLRGSLVTALCGSISLLAPSSVAGGPAAETSADAAPDSGTAAADESLSNWIDVVVGGVAIGDREAAFRRRHGGPNDDFHGGIEDFHYELLTDSGSFLLEGHALLGMDDYDLQMRYDWDDIGFVRGGFKQFRTWYDGSGGYLPRVAPPLDWIDPMRDELSIDRGEFFFEAGLRIPDLPQVTFGYTRLWRDGMKDSTSWGNIDGAHGQGIVPSYLDIDETTDIFKLDVLHTLQASGEVEITLGGGLRYHRVRNDNSRSMKEGYEAATPDDDRDVSQNDTYDGDYYNAHLFSETRFGEKALVSFGYSFTTMDSNLGGDRFSIDGDGDLRTGSDHSYFALMGGSQTAINILNANLWWNPIEDVVVVPSFRAEFWDQSAWGAHLAGVRGEPDGTLEGIRDRSSYDANTFTEQLEVRYSGLPDALIYARGILSQADGEMFRSTVEDDLMGGPLSVSTRSNDLDIDQQVFVAGANWHPFRRMSLAGQYYFKHRERNHTDLVVVGEDAWASHLESETHDFNIRVTMRPAPNVTLVSRYDFQQADIENRAFSGLPSSPAVTDTVTSGDITRNIFSQSVTWVPFERVYLQGSFHWVDASTDTKADELPGLNPLYIPDWSNDYWMLSLNGGIELGERTNLQVGYFYYDADNFVDNSAIGTPFGTEAREHAVTMRLTQQITPAMSWNIGYGYFHGEDDAYGGNRDYDAHVVSSGFRFSF